MAFEERNQATCCLLLPLKFGVGLIAMLVFVQSITCLVALFTGDIRFQPNGYNLNTYRLPSIVGSVGLVLGFVGLLGVYDERFSWLWAFNRFMLMKLVAGSLAAVADYWELKKCDSWLDSPERERIVKYGHLGLNYVNGNPAMDSLAKEHICPWARWALVLGFSIEFAIWVYFFYKSWSYELELQMQMPTPIDFGIERYDAAARWKFYQVRDPRADPARLPKKLPTINEDKEEKATYGTFGGESVPDSQSVEYPTSQQSIGPPAWVKHPPEVPTVPLAQQMPPPHQSGFHVEDGMQRTSRTHPETLNSGNVTKKSAATNSEACVTQ